MFRKDLCRLFYTLGNSGDCNVKRTVGEKVRKIKEDKNKGNEKIKKIKKVKTFAFI